MKFTTDDGKVFTNYDDAKAYEETLKTDSALEDFKSKMEEGKIYLAEVRHANNDDKKTYLILHNSKGNINNYLIKAVLFDCYGSDILFNSSDFEGKEQYKVVKIKPADKRVEEVVDLVTNPKFYNENEERIMVNGVFIYSNEKERISERLNERLNLSRKKKLISDLNEQDEAIKRFLDMVLNF